jgi:hypothetical protein
MASRRLITIRCRKKTVNADPKVIPKYQRKKKPPSPTQPFLLPPQFPTRIRILLQTAAWK